MYVGSWVVENVCGVRLSDSHTLEGQALEIALRGNTTMASNNGEQAFEREDANIYLTPLREGWVGCFCFSHQSAVLIKRAATAPPPNGAWIASERAVVDRFIHIGSSFGGFVVAVAEGAGKIRPSASITPRS